MLLSECATHGDFSALTAALADTRCLLSTFTAGPEGLEEPRESYRPKQQEAIYAHVYANSLGRRGECPLFALPAVVFRLPFAARVSTFLAS